MGKIRGKFTPLFSELGDDERFLMKLNNEQKLLYLLVLHTIYQTNNAAPFDSNYFVVRYNLLSTSGKYRKSRVQVQHDLEHILALFPKILCNGKKLSLLNYMGYENRVASNRGIEGEGELEIEGEGKGTDTPPTTTIQSKKDLPRLIQDPLFDSLTQSEKQRIRDAYPKDFLTERLSHYIESAAMREKPITLMKSETIKKFLTKDFGDWQNSKAQEAAKKRDKKIDTKALEENAAPPPEEFKNLQKKLKGEADEKKQEESAGQVRS